MNSNIISSIMFALIVLIALKPSITIADVLVYTQGTNQLVEEFRDLPARFGASLPMNGLRVAAIPADPSDACRSIARPPSVNSTEPIKWVVLIARYNCSFEDKIRFAQTAGYSAAIVYNINSNELEQMSANNDQGIDIPSVFVGESSGKIIIYNYQYNDDFYLVINDDLPFNINTHIILPFSIVVGMCFIIMIGFMIVKCVREQRRLRRHRLPNSVLKKIPQIKFCKGQQSPSYETCAICLDDYVDGDKLRILPCAHAYHSKCIDPWLTKNRRVCPICKRKVFARGEPRRRQRRSSDDSLSDSDGDDTTPLLNPVDHTNHGTFPQANNDPHAVYESVITTQSSRYPAPNPSTERINPFDRSVNVAVVFDDTNTTENLMTKVLGFLGLVDRNRANHDDQSDEQNILESSASSTQNLDAERATTNVMSTSPPRSSSSNNVLNGNLSGSFKRCQRYRGRGNRNSDQQQQQQHQHDDDDDDDDSLDDGIHWHTGSNPHTTIFAPISASQPSALNSHQYEPTVTESTSQYLDDGHRVLVAAIPNINFNQPIRATSSSSPSIYSNALNRNDSGAGDSAGAGNRTQQRKGASSNDYYV